ncbi:immunity protein YezG family protein [Anaeromicropila populeti]|uniref:DUF600 family protein n=1 Tax=Anaeromicropila populeti TaxID=37658 RepID=A0A1I6HTE1_9FIRM|nr:immunity protein YezG family protein [Anaeromicropila populeti]SFR57715.1 conserved hypothetical protein [Anaeromicropila populeti]
MDEKILTPIYGKIANQLNEIIPGEWKEIVLYAEELGDTRTALFFFKNDSTGEFIHSSKIPDIYHVDRKIYFKLMKELSMIVKDLREKFLESEVELWNSITFFLDSDFKFSIQYNYEWDDTIGSYERGVIWAYEMLQIVPHDDFGKQVLNEYLEK